MSRSFSSSSSESPCGKNRIDESTEEEEEEEEDEVSDMSVVNESIQESEMSFIIEDEVPKIETVVKMISVPKAVIDENKRAFTTNTHFRPVPKSLIEDLRDSHILADDSCGSTSTDDTDIIVEDSFHDNFKPQFKNLLGHSTFKPDPQKNAANSTDVIDLSSDNQDNLSDNEVVVLSSDDEESSNVSSDSKNDLKHSTSGEVSMENEDCKIKTLQRQVFDKKMACMRLKNVYKNCPLHELRDGGKLLQEQYQRCKSELEVLKQKLYALGGTEIDMEDENLQLEPIFLAKDQKTDHLGKKGLQTHRVETALTMDALVTLHNSLATCPSNEAMAEAPQKLKSSLMPHQLKALPWLLHREKQKPSGGILADDMGLGKTITMIALILHADDSKDDKKPNDAWYRPQRNNPDCVADSTESFPREHPGKTLVVAPATLIGQWESQIKEHTKRGSLSSIIHHGNSREVRGRSLCNFDIVITSYGVVTQENKGDRKGALFRVEWERVILDEAHTIRNHKTLSSKAACDLKAKHRWCLTGTPVHNKELDMYALLKFLRCSPFDDLAVWKRWVDNKSAAGAERLNTVVRSIMLRRTKADLMASGGLQQMPSKHEERVEIQLDDEENRVYLHVLNFSKTLLAQYLHQKTDSDDTIGTSHVLQQLQQHSEIKTHEILVLLLRLRQICCLPGLIQSFDCEMIIRLIQMLEEESCETDGIDSKRDLALDSLSTQVKRLSIGRPIKIEQKENAEELEKVLLTSNPVFKENRTSSKIRSLMDKIREILKTDDKIVIVSQWSSYLRILNKHLKSLGAKIATLDGSVSVKDRPAIIESFNKENGATRILLLSLTAGGVGLNLMGGNRLFLMEPHWNPQLEAQACDRIYRFGQRKPCYIYKVICKGTIEERIESLQKKKLEIADNVLSGQAKKDQGKLTLQDLKSLFDL